MPTLAAQQEQFLVLQMFLMREGLRDVPQMAGTLKDFSDRDLDDVAAYFAGQKPPVARPREIQSCARAARHWQRGWPAAAAISATTAARSRFRGSQASERSISLRR